MKAQGLNKKKQPTQEEMKEIAYKLMEAGIDKTALAKIFGTELDVSTDCTAPGPCIHEHECISRYRVDPDTVGKLKDILDSRKIDINKIDPKIRKMF